MQKRKFISTRTLKAGMKIDQAIVDQTGRHLIKRGARLDDFQIEYLQGQGIGGIYIVEGEADPEDLAAIQIPEHTQKVIEKTRVPDRSKVILTEDVKKRVGEGVQYVFANPDAEGFTEAAENISSVLMDTIMSDDAVAVDINMLKVSDEYTFRHSVDVATIAMIIGRKYGLNREQIREIGTAGLLHDVGKSKIPNEVLNKPSQLTDEEFEQMKMHSTFGYRILQEKGTFSKGILLGVLQHHEKVSGDGYPIGLKEDQIHTYAKIISVADIYDALVTDRPYKKAFSKRTAMEMVLATSQALDVDVIQSFMRSVILFPVDAVVELSNGEKAKVVKNDPEYPLRPTVVSIESGRVYDLSHDLNCANIIIL